MPDPAVAGGSIGFFGKIPSRGDFVRAGLPRDFVDPWDDWLGAVIAGSQTILGETWLDAWMQAPIWRFRLTAGICGAQAALGVWMPSVDRAGRHFPLTLARTGEPGFGAEAWLGMAEAAGLAALQDDLEPDALLGRLTGEEPLGLSDAMLPDVGSGCVWWTDGSPLVPAQTWHGAVLPGAGAFAAMLRADETVGIGADEAGEQGR